MEQNKHMRVITCSSPIRVGVRRDGEKDGLVWRLFLAEGNEEISLKNLQFTGLLSPATFAFQSDLQRNNPGKFLAWLRLAPARIEIEGDSGTLHFAD